MELNIVVMDDETEFCNFLKEKIINWGEASGKAMNVTCFNTSDLFLEVWRTQKNFDAVFLDIKMFGSKLNGMEVAKKIRESSDCTRIVFITSMSDYARDGYLVNAERYLTKPVSDYEFNECMKHLADVLEDKENKVLLLKFKDKLVRIPYRDIVYFSSLNNYIEIHTKSETVKYLKKLKYIEDILPSRFVRCHRSMIINIENVSAVKRNEVILINGEKLPVSKQYSGKVQRMFIRYFG